MTMRVWRCRSPTVQSAERAGAECAASAKQYDGRDQRHDQPAMAVRRLRSEAYLYHSPMPLAPGETFAGYRILRQIGSGGMGEVYLAEHPRLPRRDALKVLPTDVSADTDYRARFEREADLASKLYHPHIVGVHDRGEHEGQLWISMDYVDGLDAARLLARRFPAGIPSGHVVGIVTAVASALDYAHKQGLVHRDVKSDNIMLTHFDEGRSRAPRAPLPALGPPRC
jgi:serine/threonine protein kinase